MYLKKALRSLGMRSNLSCNYMNVSPFVNPSRGERTRRPPEEDSFCSVVDLALEILITLCVLKCDQSFPNWMALGFGRNITPYIFACKIL
jgi:hypothetical protein